MHLLALGFGKQELTQSQNSNQEEPVSSQQQKRAVYVESARMPSVSQLYELQRQLGDQAEDTCVIPLPRPRFNSPAVTQWINDLAKLSGVGGGHFKIISFSLIGQTKHIDAYIRVRRLTKPQP